MASNARFGSRRGEIAGGASEDAFDVVGQGGEPPGRHVSEDLRHETGELLRDTECQLLGHVGLLCERHVARRGEPVEVGAENVVIMAGNTPYTIESGSSPGADDGKGSGRTTLMTCWYSAASGMPARLLGSLPPLAVLEGTKEESCPISPAGFAEIGRAEPGRQAFLDRMLDLLLIAALRAWFTRPGADVPAWYAAHRDPVAGTAMRLLDDDLSRRWTIEELARKVGVSRAALARRFTGLVGQPPMAYLRQRRLDRAGELLKSSDSTIGAIATQVGFSTPFALSAAFKRERGISPSQYREG